MSCQECSGYVVITHEYCVCRECGLIQDDLPLDDTPVHQSSSSYFPPPLTSNAFFGDPSYDPSKSPTYSPPHQQQQQLEDPLEHEVPLINHSYHRKRIKHLFGRAHVTPAILHKTKFLLEDRNVTREEFRGWNGSHFRELYTSDPEIPKSRCYRWQMSWISTKYRVLDESPPLILQANFFDTLEFIFTMFEELWIGLGPITSSNFPRIPWILSKLVTLFDRNYEHNKAWYLHHWGGPIIDRSAHYSNLWALYLIKYRERGIIPITQQQPSASSKELSSHTSSSSSSPPASSE